LAIPQTDVKVKLPQVVDIAYDSYKSGLPRYRLASDIMTQEVFTVTPETSLDEAAQTMGKKHIGSLIVMKYKTPVGIITERDLLSKVLAYGILLRDQTVEQVMSFPLITVSSTSTIKEAAQLMTEKKSRLAVFYAGNMVGIMTASDLIKSLPDVAETEAIIDDFMTKDLVTATEETPVINIAKTMGNKRVGSIIITHYNTPSGIFTERDLLTHYLAQDKSLFSELGQDYSKPLIAIPAGTSVHRAAAVMASKHIRRLPVIKNDKLIGIITARDLVEAYAK
jgi:CBS domain-containing protein